MGMVFLGEHMLLGRRAAIKTLLPTVAVNQEIVDRFFNEARAASAITDPGVIQIFDFGYHVDGTAYIVMELLEGEALSTRIARLGKLPLPDAIRIARQIAGSLAAAHACNVVHRDLKPENIFLVRDSEAQGGERTKILDFGICKVGPSDGDPAVTQVGAMVGTPVYMSPEQCRGTSDVDHRSDIYAFGCLLFHMLTGRPPFIGDSSGDLIVAHMQADPPSPGLYVDGLPFEVDALVLRCLAKSPEDRFPSMTELHLVLGDIHAQLDPTESTVAAVTPSMPLGRGFRSVYDGNLSRFPGASSRISPASKISPMSRISPATHRLRPQLKFVSTPPVTPPKLRPLRSSQDLDCDDDLAALLRPRRRALHAVLACLVVAGVVVGLATSPLFHDTDDRRAEAEPGPVAAAPSVRELDPPARPTSSDSAAATSTSAPNPESPAAEVTSQVDRTVERTPAPDTTHAPAAPPAPETSHSPAISAGPVVATRPAGAPESSPTGVGRPVTSPGELPPGVTPPSTPPTESGRPIETPPDPGPAAATAGSRGLVTTLKKPEPSPSSSPSGASGGEPATSPTSAPGTASTAAPPPSAAPDDRASGSKTEAAAAPDRSQRSREPSREAKQVTRSRPSPPASKPAPSPPSAAPSPPPPPRPSPSKEDLYDTR
jgi:serine/threonine protein kinase